MSINKIATNLEAALASAKAVEITFESDLKGMPTCVLFKLHEKTHERLYPITIIVNKCFCNCIAALLNIPLNSVIQIAEAHERGHILDWFLNSQSNEDRAWLLAKEYFVEEANNIYTDLVKEFCNSKKDNPPYLYG